MADNETPPLRFARDVAASAPKPGFHLATISLDLRGESVILWVIEGPDNDTVGMLGMRTDFRRTRLLRFSVRGSLLEGLNGLYPLPSDRGFVINFYGEDDSRPSPIGVERADVVFSSLRAYDRADPDSAAVRYSLSAERRGEEAGKESGGEAREGGRVIAAVTGYQRGWAYHPVITAGACALWVLETRPEEGTSVDVTVRLDLGTEPGRYFEVSGDVLVSYSVMGTGPSSY
jgi:hypothetical protein